MRIINNAQEKEKRRRLRNRETAEEKIVWSILRGSKLGFKWRRQVSIGSYVADFYCRQKKLVLEIDGGYHDGQQEYDIQRMAYFKSLGIRTIRFKNESILEDIDACKRVILKEMDAFQEENDSEDIYKR